MADDLGRSGRHIAEGYASDDEGGRPPARPRGGFGALPGDKPTWKRLSASEVLDYGVRQASSGPSGKKARYLDACKGPNERLSRAQTKARGTYASTYERHCALLNVLQQARAAKAKFRTDEAILRDSHRFLRSSEDDDGSWEAKLAARYYQRLFREYVICDLAGYRAGDVGFRWRTEAEVVHGKGQFCCGQRRCEMRDGLRSYEVDFKYREAGQKKRALVKARLCEPCAYKLHYRRLKKQRRRAHQQAKGGDVLAKDEVSEVVDAHASDSEADRDSAEGGRSAEGGQDEDPKEPSEAEKRLLESLAWRGPDPDARTRQDEFDDYLADMFV